MSKNSKIRFITVVAIVLYLFHQQLYTTNAQNPTKVLPVLQTGHSGTVTGIGIRRDGRLIVTGDDYGVIKFWDSLSNRLTFTVKAHQGRINVIEFSPDGTQVISGGEDGILRLWDTRTGRLIRFFAGHTSPVNCVAFSPDGSFAISGGGSYGEDQVSLTDNVLRIWNIRTGRMTNVLRGHTSVIVSLAFNRKGTQVVSSSRDDTVRVWEINGGDELIRIPATGVDVVSFSPDGSTVASATARKVVFWDASTGRQKNVIAHDEYSGLVFFTADWRQMFVESYSNIQIWDLENQRLTRTLESQGEIRAFTPDGKFLAIAGPDALSAWDIARDVPVREFGGAVLSPKWTTGATFSKSGRLAAWIGAPVAGTSESLQVGPGIYTFDVEKAEIRHVFSTDDDFTNELTFSPDEKTLVSCGNNGPKVYSLASAAFIQNLNTGRFEQMHCESVAYSPDGNRIVFAGLIVPRKAGTSEFDYELGYLGIQVVDAKTWRLLRTLKLPKSNNDNPKAVIHSVAFSPTGKYLATGDDFDGLVLWDVRTGLPTVLKGNQSGINSVSFDPTGARIATAGFDHTIKIWDATTRQVVKTLPKGLNIVACVRYSLDGQYLISGNYDESIRITNLRTNESTDLYGHTAPVNFVAVSPDGKLILSTSLDGMVNVWSIQNRTLVSSIYITGSKKGVNFTPDGYFYELLNGGRELLSWRLSDESLFDPVQADGLKNDDIVRSRYRDGAPVLMSPEMQAEIPRSEAFAWSEYDRMLRNEWRNHKFYAIVIGNDKYHEPWTVLKNSENDARAVKQVLEQNYNFNVTPLYSETKSNILSRINSLAATMEPDSSFVLFYSGHGEEDKVTDEAFWIPVDATGNRRTWISSDEIFEAIKRIKSRHVLIIADSCFAGGLDKGLSLLETFDELPEIMLSQMKKRSRILIASGGNEPVSGAGDRHSIFGEYLIKGLQKLPRNIFPANKLFYDYIYQIPVQTRLRQRPLIRDIGYSIVPARSKDEKGDQFYFVRSYP